MSHVADVQPDLRRPRGIDDLELRRDVGEYFAARRGDGERSHLPLPHERRLSVAVRIARRVGPADAEQSQNSGIRPRGDVKRDRSQQPATQLKLAVAKIVRRIDVANAERQMIGPARLLRRHRWE